MHSCAACICRPDSSQPRSDEHSADADVVTHCRGVGDAVFCDPLWIELANEGHQKLQVQALRRCRNPYTAAKDVRHALKQAMHMMQNGVQHAVINTAMHRVKA